MRNEYIHGCWVFRNPARYSVYAWCVSWTANDGVTGTAKFKTYAGILRNSWPRLGHQT